MASSCWKGASMFFQQPLLSSEEEEECLPPKICRGDFPSGFTFGVATSAYQIEGAAMEDGRGTSIWDSFSHILGNIYDGSTGDTACNHYHKYEGDVQLMVELGIDAYRFSISWSRLFPDDTLTINQRGVSFYNKLINDLIRNGIEPYVTLYHWDLPQALENNPDIKGWRSSNILKYFAHYAETCFKLFGDRVKNWITFNQISTFAVSGYGTGKDAPGRCSAVSGSRQLIVAGDSSTEPYVVAHYALLSHAAAVKVYKCKYQSEQKGRIGITVNSKWYEPYTSRKEDADAAQRCIEFELAWVLDPLLCGEYPLSMRCRAGSRLPFFSRAEVNDLKGSLDFVGFNYYTSYFAKRSTDEVEANMRWYETDRMAIVTATGPDGKLIGEAMGPPDIGWIYNCPWGLPKLLGWMEDRYGKEKFMNLPFIITENGADDSKLNLPVKEALNDWRRIHYLTDNLQYLADAIKKNKHNVEGFFVWSLLDNFEWETGLINRFGLYYVDYHHNFMRCPKRSACWYQDFLQINSSLSKPLISSRGCLGQYSSDCFWGNLLKLMRSLWPFQLALYFVKENPIQK